MYNAFVPVVTGILYRSVQFEERNKNIFHEQKIKIEKGMGALYTIISYSLGNLFLGVLLTIVGVGLMFFLIRSWFSNSSFTPFSYIIGFVLFLFLSFQAVLLCGAVTIKSYGDEVEVAINEWVRNLPDDVRFNKASSQQVLEQIQQEWPLVGYFVGGADFTGHTPVDIAHAMTEELHSFMNGFILRRIGWSLLFVVVGAFIVIKTMEHTRRQRNRGGYASARSRRRRYDD